MSKTVDGFHFKRPNPESGSTDLNKLLYSNCHNESAQAGKLIREVTWSCSIKKGVFKNFAKFTGNHL